MIEFDEMAGVIRFKDAEIHASEEQFEILKASPKAVKIRSVFELCELAERLWSNPHQSQYIITATIQARDGVRHNNFFLGVVDALDRTKALTKALGIWNDRATIETLFEGNIDGWMLEVASVASLIDGRCK